MVGSREVLILGGSGFLGVHLVRAAAAAIQGDGGWDGVVSASRDPALSARLTPPAGVSSRPVDAVAPGRLEDLLADLCPVAVILATALSRVGECERYPGLAEELNVRLPERVARWCAGRGARLVHVSTDLVFGGEPPRDPAGFREDDSPAPVHVYGRTKARGEERVLELAPDALVVRLPLLYGDSLGRGLGASDQVLAAVAAGERPRLFTDEWRAPLDVGDAAEALVELAGRPERGLLHVAGPERLSRLELGRRVLDAAGLPGDAVEPALRADLGLEQQRPEDCTLAAERAAACLGTRLRTVSEALEGSSGASPP